MATAGSVEIAPTLLSLDGEKVKLNVSTSAGYESNFKVRSKVDNG